MKPILTPVLLPRSRIAFNFGQSFRGFSPHTALSDSLNSSAAPPSDQSAKPATPADIRPAEPPPEAIPSSPRRLADRKLGFRTEATRSTEPQRTTPPAPPQFPPKKAA